MPLDTYRNPIETPPPETETKVSPLPQAEINQIRQEVQEQNLLREALRKINDEYIVKNLTQSKN